MRSEGGAPVRPARGFTLMELLIVVAVISVLAAVAYPSYQKQVQAGRRAEAKAALTEVAQRLERYYTENNTYLNACLAGTAGCTAAATVYAATTENGHYALSLPAANRSVSTFLVTATPRGGQAGDACGTFTLRQDGERRVIDGTETDARKCW